LLVLSACTRAKLVPIPEEDPGRRDDRIKIEGKFRTTDPETLNFPVKVLFVIDDSQSMTVTDPITPEYPAGYRPVAIADAIETLSLATPGIQFALITFGAATTVLTEACDATDAGPTNCQQGFTDDMLRALSAAGQAGNPGGGVTNYDVALTSAYTTLFKDMSDLAEEDAGNARYVVIFVSDGIPDVDNGRVPECNETESIIGAVQDIADLKKRFRLRELTFNTILVSSPTTPTQFRDVSRSVLNCMARFGNGVFRDFDNGGQLNFLNFDFTSYRRTFTVKNLIVANINARPGTTDDITDSDGDGLTDEEEFQIGSDPTLLDTDGDFFNDLLEHRLRTSGLDPLDPLDGDCSLDVDQQDTDGDGLRDCEERFLGTKSRLFDSDFDGVPDLVEVWFDTLTTVDDLKQDLDFDGSFNGDEIRWHSNPRTNDSGNLSDLGYRYVETSKGPYQARYEYDFSVSNIRLASTLETPGGELGRNRIMIYLTEVPQDDPGGVAIHRVGCVTARYVAEQDIKDPPGGVIRLIEDNLKLPVEFNPDVDCVGR